MSRSFFFSLFDNVLVGDENTIEELTFILLSDLNRLADASAAEGDSGVVEALEDNLVLDIGVVLNSDSGDHVNVLDLFTSEEVLDIDAVTVSGDDAVNGEMSVYGSHFVLETLSQVQYY
jgi:hypothetical protein